MYRETLKLRLIGFALSCLFTLGAYFIIIYPEAMGITWTLIVISLFAVLQFIVQFIFFLEFWREKGPYWNIGFFISTLAMIVLIIAFSIWIMKNLNYNMMP